MTSEPALPAAMVEALVSILAERTGIRIPPERGSEIEWALRRMTPERKKSELRAEAATLLGSGDQRLWEGLASHLTVGETYFYRDERSFRALEETVLPDLIGRRGGIRRLRLWSAACATGEEAYSLAILADRMGLLSGEWECTVLATDLNREFLERARRGVYRPWSFRGTPAWLRETYFRKTQGGEYEIVPKIRAAVCFAPLNLADDALVRHVADGAAFDLILLRNVLIYFSPAQARATVLRLAERMAPDGWMLTTPAEGVAEFFAPMRSLSSVGLYQRGAAKEETRTQAPPPQDAGDPFVMEGEFAPILYPQTDPEEVAQAHPAPSAVAMQPVGATSYERALALYREGRYDKAIALLEGDAGADADEKALELLARAYASRGDVKGALAHCDRLLAVNKMSSEAHALKGLTLWEAGRATDAERSFRRALYLDHESPLAHYVVAMIERRRGAKASALRRLRRAARALEGRRDDARESLDGLTVGRLRESIRALEES